MANIEKYIVTGGDNFPDWFKEGSTKGLVRVVMNEDGEFDYILVNTPTGRKFAKKGDVVVKTRSGFSVISGEQAQKYKVTFIPKQKKVEKTEDKKDEVDE